MAAERASPSPVRPCGIATDPLTVSTAPRSPWRKVWISPLAAALTKGMVRAMLALVSSTRARSMGTVPAAKNATDWGTPSSSTVKSLPVNPLTYSPARFVTVTVSGTSSTPLR